VEAKRVNGLSLVVCRLELEGTYVSGTGEENHTHGVKRDDKGKQ
jgi:hypothetical protein